MVSLKFRHWTGSKNILWHFIDPLHPAFTTLMLSGQVHPLITHVFAVYILEPEYIMHICN